jgi:hypothetical protein
MVVRKRGGSVVGLFSMMMDFCIFWTLGTSGNFPQKTTPEVPPSPPKILGRKGSGKARACPATPLSRSSRFCAGLPILFPRFFEFFLEPKNEAFYCPDWSDVPPQRLVNTL